MRVEHATAPAAAVAPQKPPLKITKGPAAQNKPLAAKQSGVRRTGNRIEKSGRGRTLNVMGRRRQ